MPDPITIGLTGYSLLKGLFGKKSPEEKARERLAKISERGLDPELLNRALGILNARNQAEQSGALSRLAAGGIDPSSGLAQEAAGAIRRGLGARQGEAQALFNERSEAAKLAATQQLAGMPADNSLGDLISSSLIALQASRNPKSDALTTDDVAKIMGNRKDYPMSTDFDISAPRGSIRLPSLSLSPQVPQPGFYDAPLRLQRRKQNFG